MNEREKIRHIKERFPHIVDDVIIDLLKAERLFH